MCQFLLLSFFSFCELNVLFYLIVLSLNLMTESKA